MCLPVLMVDSESIGEFYVGYDEVSYVPKKAQEEVDQVVGRDRLPTFADWDKLPHINCCARKF
jgi:hypothetical protein